jgi:hypothetical protein
VRDVTPVHPYKDIVMVPSPTDRDSHLRFESFVRMGVRTEIFRRMRDLSLKSAIAQYYGNVQDGMIFADMIHLFRGLERPLMQNDNMHADRGMLMFSWVPRWDWELNWDTQYPERVTPPPQRVFTVIAHLFEKPDEHEVVAELLHWTWIQEDWTLKGAPIDWEDRFAEKLWTKRKR